MSYCRFSTNNYKSDVYVYDDVGGGITIHVATSRVASKVPKVTDYNDSKKFAKQVIEQQKAISTAKYKKNGLPYDGESFYNLTPREALERLFELRAAGYRIPQSAIDGIKRYNFVFDKNRVFAGQKRYYYEISKDLYYCFYDGFGGAAGTTTTYLRYGDYHKARFSDEGLKEAEKDFNRHKKRIEKLMKGE